jgi:hypothetical protein
MASMVEALVVLGVVAALCLLGVMAVVLPLETLVFVGVVCVATGIALGVPAGAYYHVKLYRYLAANGGVPRGFIWHPTRYHDALPTQTRRGILPWFFAGALGFLLILLGCALVILGVLRV